MKYRTEHDSMGSVEVPQDAYWGAQTQRAKDNFNVSSLHIHPFMIRGLALVKKHAAIANQSLNVLPQEIAKVIIQSADEVIEGKFDNDFPIDVMQTGSGTSWNMNMNEVIANRSNELLGLDRNSSEYTAQRKVHPNDHVNRGQSSNDSIPTAIYIACSMKLRPCLTELEALANSFQKKSEEFRDVLKIGRTHLQDAVPMTLGQEFLAFSQQFSFVHAQLQHSEGNLLELPQGGTAVGTGVNSPRSFSDVFVESLSKETGISFLKTDCAFTRMAGAEPFVSLMGAVSVLATSFLKIANDIRLLASGPRTSIAEITLPELQPGSSIMPGKINPVIPEMTIQAAAHLLGKAEAVRTAAQNGPLQLIMMFPLIAHECITALELSENTCSVLRRNCVEGIKANEKQAGHWIEQSLALITPLALSIGYDKAAALAHRAFHENRTIRSVLKEEKILTEDELNRLLDPKTMI